MIMFLSEASPGSPRSVIPLEEPDAELAKVDRLCEPSLRSNSSSTFLPGTNRVSFELPEEYDGDADENDATTEKRSIISSDQSSVKVHMAPIRPVLSPDEIKTMCWTNRNFKEFKAQAKKLAQLVEEDKHGDYLRLFLNVYSDPPEDEKRVGYVNSKDGSALPLAMAPTRGLEKYVFPGIQQDQRRIKDSVLKVQASLPNEMDQATRETVLSSTSKILSRSSRRVARVLGHADSIVALSIYKRTFPVQKK